MVTFVQWFVDNSVRLPSRIGKEKNRRMAIPIMIEEAQAGTWETILLVEEVVGNETLTLDGKHCSMTLELMG